MITLTINASELIKAYKMFMDKIDKDYEGCDIPSNHLYIYNDSINLVKGMNLYKYKITTNFTFPRSVPIKIPRYMELYIYWLEKTIKKIEEREATKIDDLFDNQDSFKNYHVSIKQEDKDLLIYIEDPKYFIDTKQLDRIKHRDSNISSLASMEKKEVDYKDNIIVLN